MRTFKKIMGLWMLLLEFAIDIVKFLFSYELAIALIAWCFYLDKLYYQRYNVAITVTLCVLLFRFTRFKDIVNSARARFLNW
jgi:hypothetical protein